MERKKLIDNLENIHTTKLGIERIKNNLKLECEDVVEWCCNKIKFEENNVYRKGKNWYVEFKDFVITINVKSYTIITAHVKNGQKL